MAHAGLVICSVAVGVFALLLVACGPATAQTSQALSPTPPPPTAIPTLQPTATPLGANPCASSSDAQAASILKARGVPIPAGAIITDQGDIASDGPNGGAEYSLFGVCATSTTPNATTAFYVARMPAAGWTHSATVPAPGGGAQPCGYANCWIQDTGHGTTLVVTLRNMRTNGLDTEFTLVYESVN